MSRMVKYLAYAWALMAGPIVLATFMGTGPSFTGRLVAFTGLHVHPIYTGGEVIQTINHDRYQTLVHRPVFDGLIRERNTGFVQIEWRPKDANLPELIDEQIDFDLDGKADMRIQLNTSTNATALDPLDSRVLSANEVVTVHNSRLLRVSLMKKTELTPRTARPRDSSI
jgi:hypothetical protein